MKTTFTIAGAFLLLCIFALFKAKEGDGNPTATNYINVTNQVTVTNYELVVVTNYEQVDATNYELSNEVKRALETSEQERFRDGVKYGALYIRRYPLEDSLEKIESGALDLWRVMEVEHGSNTLSAAYLRVYPPSTFEEGVEYGANVLASALRTGNTNVTIDQIKLAAYAMLGRVTEGKKETNQAKLNRGDAETRRQEGRQEGITNVVAPVAAPTNAPATPAPTNAAAIIPASTNSPSK